MEEAPSLCSVASEKDFLCHARLRAEGWGAAGRVTKEIIPVSTTSTTVICHIVSHFESR